MHKMNRTSGRSRQSHPGRRSIALLGCHGFNVNHRLTEELQQISIDLVTGYDLNSHADSPHRFCCVRVSDDEDLTGRLRDQCPGCVFVETPDDVHSKHIAFGLNIGARVLCEKPVAANGAELARLRERFEPAKLQQRLFIIDHYKNLELVQILRANARRWLGTIERIIVVLLESQDIGTNQIRSHSQGMANFFHHVLAVAGEFVDLSGFQPIRSVTANHPNSPVCDTYRAAIFQRKGPFPVVIQGAVGKYMEHSTKSIFVEGSRGWANLDRGRGELRVECADGWSTTINAKPDNGYRGLARTLKGDDVQMSLVRFTEAVEALRLLEAAQQQADWLRSYPNGRTQLFSGATGPTKRAA